MWCFLTLFILHLYGFLTTLFTSWVMHPVVDEPLYIEQGTRYIKTGTYDVLGVGHPPFSVCLGGVLPAWFNLTELSSPTALFAARLPHVILFAVIGIILTFLLRRKEGNRTALIFAATYNTLPGLKAIAAHHLTDLEVALFITFSSTLLWYGFKKVPVKIFLAFFLFGLALLSKITALLAFPFLFLSVFSFKDSWEKKIPSFSSVLLGILLAAVVIYHFDFTLIPSYFEIIKMQATHNKWGHPTSLLQMQRSHGFWYYYLVVFFFKTPIPTLFMVCYALFLRAKYRATKDLDLLFFLPALTLFVFLCSSHVQLGFRYFLPCLLLLLTASSILAGRYLPSTYLQSKLLCGGLLVLLAIDLHSVTYDSYLTYFNILSPRPTLNFSDSNIDWNQGIPRHLEKKVPPSELTVGFLEFLKNSTREKTTFIVGATELNAIWKHPLGAALRSIPPVKTMAGHDFITVSKQELFWLLREKKPFQNYLRRGLKELSQSVIDLDKRFYNCPSGEKAVLKYQSLLSLQEFSAFKGMSKQNSEERKTFDIHLEPGIDYLIVVASNEGVELKIDEKLSVPPRWPMSEWRNMVHWMPLSPLTKTQKVEAVFRLTHFNAPEKRMLEILAFSWKCERD